MCIIGRSYVYFLEGRMGSLVGRVGIYGGSDV